MSEIHSLTYQPGKSKHVEPYRYNRVPADSLNLIANHGIEGDFKAGRNVRRQLNIMSYEMVMQLKAEGYKTAPGELGEQIVIHDLDVSTLPRGTRLQIGDDAIVEIGGPREPCDWFELIQGKPHQEAEKRVGVMAKVIQTGVIRVGDTVKVIESVQTA
jgi:MOSC domain-containing protein YiiM